MLRARRLCAAIVTTLMAAAPAFAGTLVTNHVVSLATTSQSNVPVTFGQIFKDGDVPAGATVSATLNGQPIQLQVDAKATNSDGSLRHAVLTAMIPTLAGNSTEPLAIAASSPSTQAGPVTLSQLLSTTYDATFTASIGGTTYAANARKLLQAASTNGSCKPWGQQCNVWLSGPLVSEWVVGGPVATSSGSRNSNLAVYFAVRAYAGPTQGSIAYVRTDVIVENTWAYAAQADLKYTATLTSGSASYTSPALSQYPYTRWHKVLWWNSNQPQVYLRANTQYIQSTGAVSRYEVLQPDDSFLNSVRQTCAPLDHCDQTQDMSSTGAQPGIGPLPTWTSTYIIDPDIRAYRWMLADANAAGTYSFHFRDAATDQPLSIQAHPYVTVIDWGDANSLASQHPNTWGKDLLPNCAGCGTAHFRTGNPYIFNTSHHPSIGYVPYMVTGDFYYFEEMEYVASYLELWSNPNYRQFSQGLIRQGQPQTRGKAWTLRSVGDAAYLTPDSAPLKSEFMSDINNSIADFIQNTVNNPNASPLGAVADHFYYSLNGSASNGIAPWQDDFFTWAVGHLMDQHFSGASRLLNWKARFQIGLMTDWMANASQGYCWLLASAYDIQILDSSGAYIPTFSELYHANFPSLYGLTCNSPSMISALGNLQGESWQAGEMVGYPDSPTGYPANLQIGLAMAAQSNNSNAHSAWNLFQNRSVQPTAPQHGYNDNPTFAVLPRYLPHLPVIGLYANPNPVSAAGKKTTLHWTASDATSCRASWESTSATSGDVTVGPISAPTSYSITCANATGTTNRAASVTIAHASQTTTPVATPLTPTHSSKGGGAISLLALLALIILSLSQYFLRCSPPRPTPRRRD